MMFHNGRDRNSARVCQIWVWRQRQ